MSSKYDRLSEKENSYDFAYNNEKSKALNQMNSTNVLRRKIDDNLNKFSDQPAKQDMISYRFKVN